MSHYNAFEKFNERVEKKARREYFKKVWSDFLRGNYRSPEHVASVYGVTFQTAWNWWQGLVCPMGDEVATAFDHRPEAALAFFRGAA